MAKSKNRDSGRFRIYTDDRYGTEYGFQPITSPPNAYTRESGKPVSDGGLKVSPTSFDTPPPSKQPLGGEGDISGDPRSNSDFATPSNVYIIPPESTKVIVSVNSSTAIAWNDQPIVYITGALTNMTMSVNPQIVRGTQGQIISMQGVGSSVALVNGSGITVDFNQALVTMDSGDIGTFIYNATDSTWHMITFTKDGGL